MAQKKVIWTETAARQRRSILEYWVQRNQSSTYSLKLLRLSNEKANQIAEDPLIYKAAEFPDTHVAAMGILVYFIKSLTTVLSLLHSGTTGKTLKDYWNC
jgi:toxin YoeB